MGSVSEAEDWGAGGFDAVGVEDALLEGLEGGCVGFFGGLVARDGDVDYAAGGYVAGEEDRGEFDLILLVLC